jgi:hypothetical protein
MFVIESMGGSMMSTFKAQSLVETSFSNDRRRFDMTFVDAGGERHTISLPSCVASDLVPVIQSLAADSRLPAAADFTRIPQQFEVGCAEGERMVLVRFDGEVPYGLGVEIAEALSRELQEQSDRVLLLGRPELH